MPGYMSKSVIGTQEYVKGAWLSFYIGSGEHTSWHDHAHEIGNFDKVEPRDSEQPPLIEWKGSSGS